MVSFLYVCPGAHALNPSFKLNCLLLSLIFAFNLFGLQRASATIKHQQQPQIQVVFFYFSCFTGWVFLVQWMTTWLVDWLARWLGSLAYGKISRQIKKKIVRKYWCVAVITIFHWAITIWILNMPTIIQQLLATILALAILQFSV